ncbi:MAG: NAD+ synthase [Chlamydiae bacterium]|nr:NAD+ synthase [Chlamydiota bacterium]
MKVLAVQLNPTIGDLSGNTKKVLEALDRAREKKAEIVLFPELTLSGYFPDDLLFDPSFINACSMHLEKIKPATRGLFVCVGLPRKNPDGIEKPLHNSVAVFADGKLLGYKNKTLLPTYDVFDERRYFEPGKEEPIWEYKGLKIAVTICEDLWQHSDQVGYTHYRIDPVQELKSKKPDLVLNLSGSPYSFQRKETRFLVFQAAAKTLQCPLILCNQVGANDQLIFDGHSFFINAKGDLIQVAKGFVEEDFLIELNAKTSFYQPQDDGIADLYDALVLGTRDYLHKQGFKKGMLGLSGGIDSALVACIAKDALGKENVLTLGLPSRFSSAGSIADAKVLTEKLGIEFQVISIDNIFQNYLDLLEPLFKNRLFDETEENLQSRIRGMVLMAFSNKFCRILLNAGNKSEMAMGYTTLYGDMAGGLGVLHDVTKLQIYKLAAHVNRNQEIIPQAIIDKTPSAELKENQSDFDTLPPFETLDPIIEDYIEERLTPEEIIKKRKFPENTVKEVVRKIHLSEYKRRQTPISLRVTQKAFNKGRYVPIVQKWK